MKPAPEQKLGAEGPVSSNVEQATAPARVRTGGRSSFGFVGVVVRLLGANAIALLTAAVTAPLMARALGPAGRGDVAAVAVPVALTATVMVGGMAAFVGRNVARGRSPALLLGSVSPVLLVMSVAAVVAAAPVADALAPEGGVVHTALLVGLLLTPVGLLSRVLQSIATYQERWHLTIFQRLAPPGLMLVGVVGLFITDNLTVATAVTLVLLSNFLPSVFLVPILWQIGRPRLDWTVTREGIAFGAKAWMGVVASRVNLRLDQLLMIALVARRELGLYAVAVNFTSLLGMFANALVLPLGVRVAQGDREAASRAMRMTLVVLLVGGAILAALCPVVIPLAFGSNFSDATLMAVLLIVATVPQSGGAVLASALTSTDRPGAGAIAQWLAVAVTVPALLLVLPRYGGEGAAVVSIAAYSVSFACLLWSARRHIGGRYRDYLLVRRTDLEWMWRTVSEAVTRRGRRSPDTLGDAPLDP